MRACVCANCHMPTAVSIISRLQIFSIWGTQGGLLSSSLLHMGTVTLHMCLCASFITSLIFSGINPLATLLLMCLETLHFQCLLWWRTDGSSGVKSGNNMDVGVCMCVVFCWLSFSLQAWSDSAKFIGTEGDNLAVGEWERTQECQRGSYCVEKLLIISL